MIVSVKRIDQSVTLEELKRLFEKYGATKIDLKENHENREKFAFIEIPEEKKALEAVKNLDGFQLKNKPIKVKMRDSKEREDMNKPQTKPLNIPSKQVKGNGEIFPYKFCLRKPNKKPLSQFHDILLSGHYDIAFEIVWETKTPTALNPTLDQNETPCFPPNNNEEFTGYNRRWLTIDGHLAISPFTVKSAIANGFANILGGCYRVNNIEEGHKENVSKGQFLYTGKYKRYRVAMDGSSKPGIVKALEALPNGDKKITITPVNEYYLDEELPRNLNLKAGDRVYAKIKQERGHKPPIIERLSLQQSSCALEVRYHGPFYCKKDSSPHIKHKHRFYRENGSPVTGVIPAINFLPKNELKRHVSIGGTNPDNKPTEWYQDLNDIKVGSFVYFEAFNNKVTNIGKNFLFKALFNHEDTVPEGSSECTDITGKLCPRCSMFGMTDKTDKNLETIGFKGRFKSSALINDISIVKVEKPEIIRLALNDQNKKRENLQISLYRWVDEKTQENVATQELLPISGPPKPNKRDIDGYYNKSTGMIKGAKYYRHGNLSSARNINNVDADPNYTHRLRNYAQVARRGLRFTGTVGAENCTQEEIATFIMLLHSDFSDHGFKIGLGKAFGMGSVKSYINKIWIRKRDEYDRWHIVENKNKNKEGLLQSLSAHLNGFKETYEKFEKSIKGHQEILNTLKGMEQRILRYPKEGLYYWKGVFGK